MVTALERRLGVWLLLGAACTTSLSSDFEGLECRAEEPRCLFGYVCNADNRCVREDSLPQVGGGSGAGATDGGSSGSSGAAGAPGGAGGASGDAGPTPTGGSAGNPEDAGSGGSVFGYDAGRGLDALDASVLPDAQACASPVPLFRDEDEDGYGVTGQQTPGCPPLEKWALEGGDCRDDLPLVHPGQIDFFPAGYADPTRPSAGNLSFDYDCDFLEEPGPGVAPAPACNNPLACSGSGYIAASPQRSGVGINPLCGSTVLHVCQSTTLPLGLACAPQPVSATEARCK